MAQEDGQPETQRTEYTPPASRVVEQYCRRVCREMGEQFTEPEIMEGFVQFMKVAVNVKLRELNRGFDNARKPE